MVFSGDCSEFQAFCHPQLFVKGGEGIVCVGRVETWKSHRLASPAKHHPQLLQSDGQGREGHGQVPHLTFLELSLQ